MGKCVIRNHILAQKQLWVNDTDLVPWVQTANDRDTDHTPSKLPSHLTPNKQMLKDSNGKLEISQDPSCNDYWTPDINQEYRETREAIDQASTDALCCRQVQEKEQGNTLEQRVDEVTRGWEQKTKAHKPCTVDANEQCGQIMKVKTV